MNYRHGIAALLLIWAGALPAQSDPTADLLARGHTLRAIEALEAQLGENPFDPVTLNNLAVVRGDRADYLVAADLLRRAQRLAPGHPVIERNLTEVEAWLAAQADAGRIQTLPEAQRLRLPPEPPPLWP
jgi:cytochrome c-type biogenesis protein CcmH/NrfG